MAHKLQKIASIQQGTQAEQYSAASLNNRALPSVSYKVDSYIKVKETKSSFNRDITYWA